MDKSEIIKQMKFHHAEYARLSEELTKLNAPDKKKEFEKQQRSRFEKFKSKYTVYADSEFKTIDWEDVESKIFSEENIESNAVKGLGWSLGYAEDGTALIGVDYYGGGASTALAYDKVDAERYLERIERARKLAAKKK